jgi:hypothetical protein
MAQNAPTLWIDGVEYGRPFVYDRGLMIDLPLTADELARAPIHKVKVETIGEMNGFKLMKLEFNPTSLSDRLPQVTRIYMQSSPPEPDAVTKAKAMPYVNRGMPYPARGTRRILRKGNK